MVVYKNVFSEHISLKYMPVMGKIKENTSYNRTLTSTNTWYNFTTTKLVRQWLNYERGEGGWTIVITKQKSWILTPYNNALNLETKLHARKYGKHKNSQAAKKLHLTVLCLTINLKKAYLETPRYSSRQISTPSALRVL